jgi:glycogen debranching enzyme
MLAGAYLDRTGDLAFAREMWPHVLRALAWMEGDGDPDGDGFVEYARRSPDGLVQQGWKDSYDSVFHADGTLAEAPIALCEVQGYVIAALDAAASMAERLGMDGDPVRLRRRAERIRERFEECFWCEDLATYAIALDGAKRPCRVRTSNAGHALYCGVASESRAALVMQGLMAEDSFSGWGIRTLSSKEARYNPMSYHNGSVWPHDNAVIAAGFARYGFHEAATRVLAALFDASLHFDLRRTPELYCGFARTRDAGPTLYPVACAPQAWAAAAPFLLLQACFGLRIDAPRGRLSLIRPALPELLEEVHLKNVRVGDACVSLRLDRNGPRVDVSVLERRGELEVALR